MRADVFFWAAVALLLFVAEVLAPGAAMLWLALAATAVFLVVFAIPGLSMLAQAVMFAVLAIVAILVWRRWFRVHQRESDKPELNRRTAALIGRVVDLRDPIVGGRGRVQIADAFWDVVGPDLPAGARVRIVSAEGSTLRVDADG